MFFKMRNQRNEAGLYRFHDYDGDSHGVTSYVINFSAWGHAPPGKEEGIIVLILGLYTTWC